MTIFTRLFSWLGGNANTQRKGSQQSTPATSAHDDSPLVGVDGALQVSTVWACVTLLAETISSLPLITYERRSGSRVAATETQLYRILHDRPNKRQTSIQFWQQMIMNLVLRGNAYARIQKLPNGEALSLWPLSADQVGVVVDDEGEVWYHYSFDNQVIIHPASDILHICGMGNGIVGLSPLDYMRSSVGLGIAAQDHTTKTFRKNARRPGVLMSDTVLSDSQRQKLKQNFGDIVSGKDRELYVLEAQFKFEPLGMAPADIQLLETRRFSVQDLARWFGVPSVLINDTAETTSLGSSVSEIIRAFYKLKLRPKLELIEQAIQEQVLTRAQRARGMVVEFNLDAFLRESLKDRMEIYAKGVQNGILNRNETRKREGLQPFEGGDTFTAQVNLMPVGMLGTQNTMERRAVPPETIEQ